MVLSATMTVVTSVALAGPTVQPSQGAEQGRFWVSDTHRYSSPW